MAKSTVVAIGDLTSSWNDCADRRGLFEEANKQRACLGIIHSHNDTDLFKLLLYETHVIEWILQAFPHNHGNCFKSRLNIR